MFSYEDTYNTDKSGSQQQSDLFSDPTPWATDGAAAPASATPTADDIFGATTAPKAPTATPAAAAPSAAPAAQAPASSTPTDPTQQLASLVQQMGSATDPAQKAVLHDQIARAVYTTLSGQGHDVSWDGDQLMVDGRPYVIGAGGGTARPQNEFDNGDQSGNVTPPTTPGQTSPADPFANGKYGPYTTDAAGFTRDKYGNIVGYQGVPYPQFDYAPPQETQSTSTPGPTPGATAPTTSTNPMDDAFILSQIAAYVAAHKNDPDFDPSLANDPNYWLGKIKATGGWQGDNAAYWTTKFKTARTDVHSWQQPTGRGATGAGPGLAPGAAGVSMPNITMPGAPSSPGFNLTGPTYAPGHAPSNDDLAGLDLNSLMSYFGVGNPVDTSGGKTGSMTEQLLQKLLESPESMSPLEIEREKAASKDELAGQALLDERNLNSYGYETGISDSNWVQSQKQQIAGQRDQALIASNRSIDQAAAKTNKADQRAAIDLGTTATQNSINNLFKSRAEQTQAKSLAVDTTLKTAALKNDRFALEESVKQKAAELGLSADQVRLQYLLGVMDDATRKYGIDVQAGISRAQLEQAGTQFQQDLIFKYTSLSQDDAQFGAKYGIDLGHLQNETNAENFKEWLDSQKLGE